MKMRYLILILIFILLINCDIGKPERTYIEPTFELYNPNFELDSISNIRIDGYYEIIERCGKYTIDGKNFYPNKPKYGFLHFFENGFCRVGIWNGVNKSLSDVEIQFQNGKGWVFDGLYQVNIDTIKIEYLYDVAIFNSSTYKKDELIGLIKENKIEFLEHSGAKYSYPINQSDSLTCSCIGRFKASNYENNWENELKHKIETNEIKTGHNTSYK